MKMILLGFILLTVIILGIMSIPSADAASGRLTIKGESSTIYSNESVYFKGKLTDSKGYAISFEPITLWEYVNGEWKYITQGKTDARGNYKITVDANFWNYGKSVNIVANSANSIQSPSMTINIQKPYSYQIKPEVKNDPSRIVSTKLVLQIQGDTNNSMQVIPLLTASNKQILHSNSIKLYFNEEMIGTIPANKWSSIGIYKSGLYSFAVKFDGAVISGTTYQSSSAQMNYQIGDSTLDTKINPYNISNTVKNPTTTNNDSQYKDPSYKIKSKYYDALQELESGIKLSESSLSGVSFDNSDAKIKLESAWKIRYMVWEYIDEGKSILRQAESHLKNKDYQKGWEKLHQFDKQMTKAKNHISAITTEIKEGKELEDKYQEKNKSCFLFWCNTKDTTKGLDLKIKDLELKVEKIKNKQQDIASDYQSVVQNQKLVKQKTEAKQEQQRLEEQKQRELRNQKLLADQEKQRLEEQKQRELRNQKLLADQEKQRLEEQKRQEQAEYEARIEAQKQSTLQILAAQNPLLKKIMTGKVTFWAQSVPYYAAPGVSKSVKTMLDSFESWSGVQRVYNEGSADIRIQWIREFSPSQGGQYWQSQVQVGLGQTGCKGEWQPFVSHSVRQVLWHEIGHAMGHGHSSDQNNIMMGNGLQKYYEKELEESIFLEDGHFSWRSFCNGGQYTFSIKGSSESSGFKFYVITPETDAKKFIVDNEGKHWSNCTRDGTWSYSGTITCDVSRGSSLLIYNPRDNGKAINVDVTTQYTGGKKAYTMTWDKNSLREPSQYLQYLDSLR